MYKQFKSKLLFIPGAFLMITFGVTSCNNGKTDKTTEEKTIAPQAKDSIIDSANVAPGNDTKPATPAP
jgi:hypothetical protein